MEILLGLYMVRIKFRMICIKSWKNIDANGKEKGKRITFSLPVTQLIFEPSTFRW